MSVNDLTWHNMSITHRADDFDVDFIAVALLVVGDKAKISFGDQQQTRMLRQLLCQRLSPDLVDGGSVVTAASPSLRSLA